MSKYVKNVWEDRIVEYPNRYEDQNGNILTLTQRPGNIVNEGTKIVAELMNNIEDGIEALDNTISEMPTNQDIDKKIATAMSQVDKLVKKIVSSVEDVKEENIIYMIPKSSSKSNDYYDEYMFINNKPELLGTTQIDLSGYATTSFVEEQIKENITSVLEASY